MNQIKKLSYLLTDPVRFFKENKDDENELFRFALFIVRIHIAIGATGIVIFILINAFIVEQATKTTLSFEKLINTIFISIGILLFVFFIQAILLSIAIERFGRPIHWLVKWVTGKDDLLKAKRVVVYNTPFFALLLHEYLILLITKSFIVMGIVFGIVIVLSFIWQTIGIAKQYQISYGKALFISSLPFLFLIGIFGLIFLYVGFNLGFENMF